MKNKKTLIFAVSLLLPMANFAQDTTHTTKFELSLAQAQEHALQHNRQIKAANIAIQKAEKAKWGAIATMLPHVDANFNYTNFMGYEMMLNMGKSMGNISETVGKLVLPAYQALVAGGLMTQEQVTQIFAGMSQPTGTSSGIPMNPSGTLSATASIALNGQMFTAVQLSRIAMDMSSASKEMTEINIKSSVKSAYQAVVIAEESKRIMEKSSDNLRKLHAATKSMIAVGMAEETDADLLDVQVMNMENSIKAAERNIEMALNSLRLVLGLNANDSIVVTDNLSNLLATNKSADTYSTPFNIEQNINVILLNHNLNLAQKQMKLQQWSYGPTLSAFYQYNYKTYFGKEEGFNMTPPNTIGLAVKIPIFSSGERLSKVRMAKFDIETAELNKQNTIDGLLVQEKQLRYNLKSTLETYEMQKRNVEVYERIFGKTSEKYERGMVSSIDLTNISTNLLQAQGKYIGALMELFTAQTNLQKLLNTL